MPANKKVPLRGIYAALKLFQEKGTLEAFLARWDKEGYELKVPIDVYNAAMEEIEPESTSILSGSGTCKLCPQVL